MKFEYKFSTFFEEELEIEDFGNCAIEATYNFNATSGPVYKYLVIRTHLGTTSIFEYDCVVPDVLLLPKSVTNKFNRIEFSESKIISRIEKFLSNAQTAKVISADEALHSCINIIDYFKDERNY